jgi:cytochrome c oxidase assembly protein subunit 15
VIIQIVLGVLSLFASIKIIPDNWGAFEWIAQFHQLTAMLLLLTLVWMTYLFKTK